MYSSYTCTVYMFVHATCIDKHSCCCIYTLNFAFRFDKNIPVKGCAMKMELCVQLSCKPYFYKYAY